MVNEAPKKVRPFDLLKKYIPGAPPSRASDEDASARLAICQSCPQLRKKNDRHGIKNTCKKCNCFMPEKVKLSGAVCPIDKWGTVEAVE